MKRIEKEKAEQEKEEDFQNLSIKVSLPEFCHSIPRETRLRLRIEKIAMTTKGKK